MANKIDKLKKVANDKDVPIAGVAITITPERNTHTGIVYRDTDNHVRLLHLRFHIDLENESLDQSYLCVAPNIEPEDAEIVAGHCRSIARDKPPIWFSIHAESKAGFGEVGGKVCLINPYQGMNCSTFILAVFRWAGPLLVNLDGWEKRARDKRWHEQLIKWLEKRKAPAWYVKKVAKDIGCIRVRPEEVAGACLEDTLPAAFTQCEQNGLAVMAAISKHTGRTSKW